ncbi:LysE family translocator [uncultured Corynebacterium sp.]|uniref:LysE family translocator n=1 Tax=uncultured Corynebacterium sp. TaxID=159447 RepID=UPI0025CD49EE|nr:LysE family translocator [uncultured Corynebacterium sp.]
MSVSAFAALILMNLVGAAAPGPDIILVTRYATRSRRHAIAAATGVLVGVLFWCSLTVFPQVMSLIQVLGGCFLVFMGVLSIRSGLEQRKHPPEDLEEAAARLGSTRKVFRTGLMTNLSNPKIVLFLAALVAPLLPPHPPLWLSVALVLSMGLSTYLLFVFLSTVISTPAVRRRLLAAGPWIDIGSGVFFVAAGCGLVWAGL